MGALSPPKPDVRQQEEQSPKAATFAADVYHGRPRLLDKMMAAAGGPFVAGSQITIVDCIVMATLQFADEFHGVPVPQNYRTLAAWHAQGAIGSNSGHVLSVFPPHP